MQMNQRAGMSIIYLAITMTIFIGVCSLAVDFGRVEVAKTELQRAADAAARAAAASLGNNGKVQDDAAKFAKANTCDGQAIVIDKNQDVEFGDWEPATKTFTVYNGSARVNADSVRVTCRRT